VNKKIGPLPTWAWIVLMGGTVGIVLFLRKKGSTATGSESELIDPATGVPWAQEYATEQVRATEAANAAAGSAGGSSGSGGTTAAETAANAAANAAAELARLQESDKTAITLAGIQAQGLTTPAAAGAPPTFAQEIQDVSAAVGALSTLGSMFAPAPSGQPSGSGTKPKPTPPPAKTAVNKQVGNPRKGETYKTVAAKGGSWHVYSNGTRVFVKG
jgi:hypothetical protein